MFLLINFTLDEIRNYKLYVITAHLAELMNNIFQKTSWKTLCFSYMYITKDVI